MKAQIPTHFEHSYQRHLKCLKLNGMQPKTIEAYSHAIRRAGVSNSIQYFPLISVQYFPLFHFSEGHFCDA